MAILVIATQVIAGVHWMGVLNTTAVGGHLLLAPAPLCTLRSARQWSQNVASIDDDLAFLHVFLGRLQEQCQSVDINPSVESDVIRLSSPPAAASEQQRCARIADSLGFDGDLFRDVDPRNGDPPTEVLLRRTRTLTRMIDRLRSSEPDKRYAVDLMTDHLLILRFLAGQKVLSKQVDIEIAIDRSRKTVGKRLGELRARGLVARPSGQRSGESITEKGLRLLEKV